jgi:hypothetical protein
LKRVLILVEGQTEERFVKSVLQPEFFAREFFFHPTLLVTKLVKDGPNFKGGVTNYAKFKNDVRRLLNGSGGALVTTMLDYYGLPPDFPGMNTRPRGTPLSRVAHVEQRIREDFDEPKNFHPFLALHEFEAWLFSSKEELPKTMMDSKGDDFAAIRDGVQTPEEIDEGPSTAPSKRIKAIYPDYRKALHRPLTAQRIGLQRIREECPHFAAWLSAVEAF